MRSGKGEAHHSRCAEVDKWVAGDVGVIGGRHVGHVVEQVPVCEQVWTAGVDIQVRMCRCGHIGSYKAIHDDSLITLLPLPGGTPSCP